VTRIVTRIVTRDPEKNQPLDLTESGSGWFFLHRGEDPRDALKKNGDTAQDVQPTSEIRLQS